LVVAVSVAGAGTIVVAFAVVLKLLLSSVAMALSLKYNVVPTARPVMVLLVPVGTGTVVTPDAKVLEAE
jgi:hypothetical protein